ncbi:MAG: ABC transporter permease [Hyphomicrobiales bacterium]|nr:ABC transporter permease [Hyphomicrobiales bacterium]MDE2017250.1 ABC transporter permease [Hyphomicrobiales bacterium]
MTDQSAPTKTISDFEAKLDKADKAVAQFAADDRTPIAVVRQFLRRNPTAIPALVLLFSVLMFGLVADNFLKVSTLSLVLQQVTVVGVIAIAQTAIILTAGIDLSVGAILVLSSFVIGKLAVYAGVPAPLAILVGMGAGAAMGAINGLLVTVVRLPPFIVTLGTLNVFNALKLWFTGSESIRADDISAKANFLNLFGNEFQLFGARFTFGALAMIMLALFAWYLLNRTPWGRHVHAVGDDPDAALLSGIQVNRTLLSVYAFAGLVCGFGAWIAIGRVGSISPIGFETANLDSITATVIGGTSLFGGRASIAGSVLGALIVGTFNTGLALAGVDDYWQIFATGVLTIVAVAIDQWLRRASQ